MIYRLSDSEVIDMYGYRTIDSKTGKPTNGFNKCPLANIDTEQIDNALTYVSFLKPKKVCDVNSYTLKHKAENYLEVTKYKDERYGSGYGVTNGALIVAMLQSGFKYKVIGDMDSKYISINLEFNVSLNSMKKVDKITRLAKMALDDL